MLCRVTPEDPQIRLGRNLEVRPHAATSPELQRGFKWLGRLIPKTSTMWNRSAD
jgi:hypothetical protein